MNSIELAKPAKVDLTIDQGAGIDVTVNFKVKSTGAFIDWTGATLTSQIRKDTSADSDLLATITATGNDVGDIHLVSEEAEDLTEGTYQYDVYAEVPGQLPRFVLEGSLKVKGRVTRT
jgi:hypothetical protein